MGLPGARRAEKDHVLPGGDKVEGAQMHDLGTFQAAGVIEVELLDAFAGWESGGLDASSAVRSRLAVAALAAGIKRLHHRRR